MNRIASRALIAVALVGGLGLRVWWVRPVTIDAPPSLLTAYTRGNDYYLEPRGRDGVRSLVAVDHLGGYDPTRHTEFAESLENAAGRYVPDNDWHYYVEFPNGEGRMELHTERGDDGITEWLEFLPHRLAVDAFFAPQVTALFARARGKYSVYIPSPSEQTYMTVRVNSALVERVVWMQR